MQNATIYHNPNCGTSRNTLEMLRQNGIEPVVIEYLKSPPGREKLLELMSAAGLNARELLRSKESLCKELGLDAPATTDAEIIDAMVQHPILMNRPIVVTAMGTRLCRPAERVLEIIQQG